MEDFIDASNMRNEGAWMSIWKARVQPKSNFYFGDLQEASFQLVATLLGGTLIVLASVQCVNVKRRLNDMHFSIVR